MSRPARRAGGDDAVERVRAASDIVEIVGQYVTLRKLGRSWKGLCPFHQEKTPSFVVSPERQTWHCFGCSAGGDVFSFLEEAEKVDFPEALRLLAERAGITLPARRPGGEGNEGLYEACREAAEHYRRCLLDPTTGRRARDFLAARGIEPGVQERFGLGYAPAGWDGLSSRLASRHGEGVLVRAGLAIEREGGRGVYDRFRDRLVVPLRLASGRAVGFGGRTLGDDEPKYLNSPETGIYHKGGFLFGLGEARDGIRATGEAVLVEGYFDVLALHQAGFPEAVAVAGTALTPEQAGILARYASRVCLVLDGDAAGQAASARALAPLLGAGLEVRVGRLPAAEDPDSLVRRGGPEAFAAVRQAALGPGAFLCRRARESPAELGHATDAVIELARGLADVGVREALFEEVRRCVGIPPEELRAAAKEGKPRTVAVTGPAAATPATPAPPGPLPFVERSLLGLLVAVPRLAATAVLQVREEWITHPAARAAWAVIQREPQADAARWCAASRGEARALLTALAAEASAPDAEERALADHARGLEARALQQERERLRRELAAGEGQDAERARGRLERLQQVASRLRALRHGAPGMQGKGEGE